jgi:hypothetical protein
MLIISCPQRTVMEQLHAECLNGVVLITTYQTGLSKYYTENILNTKLNDIKINSNIFDMPCKNFFFVFGVVYFTAL